MMVKGKYLTKIFVFLLCFFIHSQAAFSASQKYLLDSDHTYVLWKVKRFGVSNLSGKWEGEGVLFFDQDNPQNSKINATVHVEKVFTGFAELDQHLIGPDVFNVKEYPTATYVSDKVELNGKTNAKVYGILTLRGVSRSVVMNVKLNSIGINPVTNQNTVSFTADTWIKRSDFGIKSFLPGLSNNVQLQMEVQAYQAD